MHYHNAIYLNGKEQIRNILNDLCINEKVRGEELTLQDFADIANKI